MVRSDCYLLLVVLAAAVMARTGAQVVRRGERPPLTTAVIAVEPRAGSALRTRRGRVPEKAAGYSETLADAMVDFAAAAYYCRSAACEAWVCSACRRHPQANVTRVHDGKHNGNGFVGYDPELDVVVVSFAGTDTRSMANWVDNLDEELAPYPWADPEQCSHCKVHKGFLATYNALRPRVLQLVQEALAQRRRRKQGIWVTGHSLGAALGVLCILDLLRLGLPVQASINFGQPRVGNRELAEHFHRVAHEAGVTFYRLVHARDPVPHMPLESFGFWHPPTEVWLTEDQTAYRICDESGEDPTCSDRYYVDTSVEDHLHYLGIEFGAAELEGQIGELEMRAMALDRAVKDGREREVVVVDGRGGVAVAEA